VVAGRPKAADTEEMLGVMRSAYLPGVVTVFLPAGGKDSEMASLAPFTLDLPGMVEKATAYVCSKQACLSPTTDPAQLLQLLGS